MTNSIGETMQCWALLKLAISSRSPTKIVILVMWDTMFHELALRLFYKDNNYLNRCFITALKSNVWTFESLIYTPFQVIGGFGFSKLLTYIQVSQKKIQINIIMLSMHSALFESLVILPNSWCLIICADLNYLDHCCCSKLQEVGLH